jgi:hypothetical protein
MTQLTIHECIHHLASLGFPCQGDATKLKLRCPLPGHDDRSPSAVIFPQTMRFHCSVCLPSSSISVLALLSRLDASMDRFVSGKESCSSRHNPETTILPESPRSPFNPQDAIDLWTKALARARDDRSLDRPEDQEVYRYLARRKLAPAWEDGSYGILASDMVLPDAVRSWPGRGYRLLVPLVHVPTAQLVNVQARCIRAGASPKTLLPAGSRSKRTVFASKTGLRLLQESQAEAQVSSSRPFSPVVILAEGLTDFLALSIHARVPVLAVPGVSTAASAVGPWARGRTVCLALDEDEAGERAVMDTQSQAHALGAREVRRVHWPLGAKDACEALEALGERGFQEHLDQVVA